MQDDDGTGLVMGVIFGVIASAVSLVIGVTIYQLVMRENIQAGTGAQARRVEVTLPLKASASL